MALALSITLDAARLAARIEVTGIPALADTVSVTRVGPSGTIAGVRGAYPATVNPPTTLLARDYELPFGVDLIYEAVALDGVTELESASAGFRIDYADCDAWLVDLARPTNSLEVEVQSLRELAFDMPAGVHRVLNRRAPVLTLLPAWTPSAELIVLTDTLAQRDQVRAVLGSGYPFLLRTSPELGIGNLYLGPTSFIEERILTLGSQPERRFRVACVQVERPDPAGYVPSPPNSYAAVAAQYATYAALLAAIATYEDLAYTYATGGSPSVPWLPDDV